MLVFMAFGAAAGLFIQQPHYGPRLHYRGTYTLLLDQGRAPRQHDDHRLWVEERTGGLESIAETVGCQEMIRKAAEHLKRPDLIVPSRSLIVTAADGAIPQSVVVTIKTRDPRLGGEFMDALIQEYIDFRKAVASNAGMDASEAAERIRLVEIIGDEATDWLTPNPSGVIWGAVAGFVCFVLFQWWRGDY
jgi:hypothetical protein